jgi:uncharacterized membrane protein (UPF0127 family)
VGRAHDLELVNETRAICLGRRVRRADSLWSRGVGLLGRGSLADDEGLHIVPCGSVHMFFMRFALDIVYLDRDLRVVKTVERLKPWRVSAARGAKSVLELPVGAIARSGTRPGDQLRLTPLS